MSARLHSGARVLHCLSDPASGALQARCMRAIEALSGEAEQAVAAQGAARPEQAHRLAKRISLTWPEFPPLQGKLWPRRLKKLAEAMAGYDLLCTWGEGALDTVLAHTVFADVFSLAPLVHHEDAAQPGSRSTLMRRLALGRTAALVVPSCEAERIALEDWQQPRSRVRLIPDGVDTAAYSATPKRDAVPGLVKRRGEHWLGVRATGRTEEVVPLIRALATLSDDWQLIIAGHPSGHESLVAAAERLGIDDRLLWANVAVDAPRLIGLFDLFATEDGTGALEAMASGVPVLAPRTGVAADWLTSENGPFLTAPGDEPALVEAIGRLAGDAALRRRVGEANRARAREEYDRTRLTKHSLALYRGLMPPR